MKAILRVLRNRFPWLVHAAISLATGTEESGFKAAFAFCHTRRQCCSAKVADISLPVFRHPTFWACIRGLSARLTLYTGVYTTPCHPWAQFLQVIDFYWQ
jgi:hypothetical protein